MKQGVYFHFENRILRLFAYSKGLLFLLKKGDIALYQSQYVSFFIIEKFITSNKVMEIFVYFKGNNRGVLENFFELRLYL